MYQEIHPCMAGSIDSVEINTSLLMMRECPVHNTPQCWKSMGGKKKHTRDQKLVPESKLGSNGLGWMASMLASSDVSRAAPVVHKPITERALPAYKLANHLWSFFPSPHYWPITALCLPIIDKHIIRERATLSTFTFQVLHTHTHSIGCWFSAFTILKELGWKLVGCKPIQMSKYLLELLKRLHWDLLNWRCILQMSWIIRNPSSS